MGYLALNEIVSFCNLPLHLSKPLSSVYSPNWFFKLSNRGDSTSACCILRNRRISEALFKADRLQIIVVAKKISVLQLFTSRMPKMCAILQLVSAPLNPIPIAEHFRRSHPQWEHSYGQT